MKKTILAAAVAAAVMAAPMTAAANVVIYGKIHASLDYSDLGDNFLYDAAFPGAGISAAVNAAAGGDSWQVTDRTSRLGFKGSEDLGNGLKAIWKVEIGYDLDNGGWNQAGRNSYIGLAGDWGTVLIGKHDTPLKISTGRLDVFADTMADYNTTLGFVDRRPDNVIAYISPNWNGFTFAVAGVAGEQLNNNDGGYSIAAMYFNNGFYASLAWEDVTDLGATDVGMPIPLEGWMAGNLGFRSTENEILRVGLGYIMNAFTVGFVYERQESSNEWGAFAPAIPFTDTTTDKWMLSGAYDFGNNTVKAMVGQYDFDTNFFNVAGADLNDKATAWAIGLDHKLSVRTKVYALYADSELGLHNNSAGAGVVGGGVPAAFLPVYGGNGFSMGMVHTF